jgi:NAD(P)-dependent dehydrogenase (short-subunit alcohol dehydrogenase family)
LPKFTNARSRDSALAGRTALITGASRGIGFAIAHALAGEGCNLVLTGRKLDPVREAGRELVQPGIRVLAKACDVRDPVSVKALAASIRKQFSRVDILVNNAGILRDRIFHRMSWTDWSDVINVHLHGSFTMSRACATHFREQNSGSFVHMTSTSGLVGNFGQANYMAAKMGIVGLSRGIALDMARFNVRSNCIAPFAWTRMIDSIPAETEAEKERVARIREMTPEKIAPLAVYLASDRAEGVTGQIFSVRNNEIYLFNQNRPIRTLHRSDGWTPELLDAQLKGAFGASFTPLERSGDVFSWDPV